MGYGCRRLYGFENMCLGIKLENGVRVNKGVVYQSAKHANKS
jgi:hypothetical protein